MITFAVELDQLGSESAQTSRMISSQRVSISSVNGPRRYLGVKTK